MDIKCSTTNNHKENRYKIYTKGNEKVILEQKTIKQEDSNVRKQDKKFIDIQKQIKKTKLLPSPSIIILNINVLNSPINIQMTEWLKTDKVVVKL